MNKTGRILVLDDEDPWRDEISSVLDRAGFEVESAGSTETAEQMLTKSFYHLAILDISMVPDNIYDDQGLVLLGRLAEVNSRDAMQVIVLSNYGTPEQMRTAFRDHNVADFQSKTSFTKDPAAFVSRVQETFRNKVRINLDLNIQWEGIRDTSEFVTKLRLYGIPIKRDPELCERTAAELDDLFCRLFFNAKSLLLKPLIPGQSGSSVLRATPFYESGAGQPVLVKFGELEKIDAEYRNYKEYVQAYIGGGRRTDVIAIRHTAHLAGVIYSLLGTASTHLDSFNAFFSRSEIANIRDVLQNLVHETCAPWYANPGHLQLIDLSAEYLRQLGSTKENLQSALSKGLKSVQGTHHLHFEGLSTERAFTNPLLLATERHFSKSTYECITHGDFNGDNVLVDTAGFSWLIDFECTGVGHILRDIAEMDTVVRFHFLAPEVANLEERLSMEEMLCSVKRFSEVNALTSAFKTENKGLLKAYETVVYLRTLAQKLVAQNPSDDIGEYYVALFYYSVNAIRFYGWPSIQRQHALLSASLLADQLHQA